MDGFVRKFQESLRSFRLWFLIRRQVGDQRSEVDLDGGQGLTQFIVDLARHASPLFFPGILQPCGKRSQLLERTRVRDAEVVKSR